MTTKNNFKRSSGFKKIIIRITIIIVCIALLTLLAFQISPWPSVLIIRYAFTADAKKVNEANEKFVPSGVTSIIDQQYDPNDKEARLDVYYPSTVDNTQTTLPVIIWIHGGGWVSGNKEQLSNYCRVLSSKGFVVVSVDYTIAPEKKYPAPLRQINNALKHLDVNATRYHINNKQMLLAGDSGGAHIAAQTATIISNPGYAEMFGITPAIERSKLKGVILYCGPYTTDNMNPSGVFGWFINSIMWAYMGEKDFMDSPLYKTFSVLNFINKDFPPAFISVGNADPLHTQSEALNQKLTALGVKTDTLFYPENHEPPLNHEYQFDLNSEAGKTALEKTVNFVNDLVKDK